jgi:hypothetical protein
MRQMGTEVSSQTKHEKFNEALAYLSRTTEKLECLWSDLQGNPPANKSEAALAETSNCLGATLNHAPEQINAMSASMESLIDEIRNVIF